MSMLVNLINAEIRDDRRQIVGKTVGRPQLVLTDGTRVTYSVDVDIGVRQPDGLGDVAVVDSEQTILYNVPVASGNLQLRYAEAGNAVTLSRTDMGRWQVTGFAKEMPGSYHRVKVKVPAFDFGLPDYDVVASEDLSIVSRPLTYGELGTYGGYGSVPYGAIGVFQGGKLIEVKT